jgi:ubiquinone/menaquinone biosynthesis C-methylase UbiE
LVNFDRVAPHYRWLETIAFGTVLQRARTFFLGEVAIAERVLIVGEGNGRFLLELLRECASAEVDCVEASAGMIELARQRLERNLPEAIARVHFIHSTIEDWPPPERRYDLIVTHFVLDCFPLGPLEDMITKLAQAAAPTATWLLADFDYPSARVRRQCARLWIAAMYLFFRAFAGVEARTLNAPDPFLRLRGFSCVQRKTFQCGMVKSEVWKCLSRSRAGRGGSPRSPFA